MTHFVESARPFHKGGAAKRGNERAQKKGETNEGERGEGGERERDRERETERQRDRETERQRGRERERAFAMIPQLRIGGPDLYRYDGYFRRLSVTPNGEQFLAPCCSHPVPQGTEIKPHRASRGTVGKARLSQCFMESF